MSFSTVAKFGQGQQGVNLGNIKTKANDSGLSMVLDLFKTFGNHRMNRLKARRTIGAVSNNWHEFKEI